MPQISVPFFILDVFAQQKYQGNQLGVFADASTLTNEQMLIIAREINFAETTFITGGSPETGFEVRIFTPEYEVPFAGHPALGTAYVIATHIVQEPTTTIILNLPGGSIETTIRDDFYWLKAGQPHFGPTVDDDSLIDLLGLASSDIDYSLPIELVSTGLPYLIIPVLTLDAMRSIRIDPKACHTWLVDHKLHKTTSADHLTAGFFPFCRETYSDDRDMNARMLLLENDALVEDAATGSASSCLLAYLLKHHTANKSIQVQVEQGYEMNRPSLIKLEGSVAMSHEYQLNIGGQVQFVAKGEWMI